MAFDNPPVLMDSTTVDAEVIRRAFGTLLAPAGGIVAPGDLQVSQNGTPNMSVNVAPGQLWIPGQSTTTQGPYYSRNGATVNMAIAASNPTNPRIDQVIVQVEDKAYAGSSALLQPAVITGTPTAGASLSNLVGLGTFPPTNSSAYLLAYVLVPANATSIVTADIANVATAAAARLPSLLYVQSAGSYTASSGQFVLASAGATVTLPPPAANAIVAVQANSGVSGSSPVTIGTPSGGFLGVGLSFPLSFPLGTVGASVVLQSNGSSWEIISGQQDTGWVALSLASNITSAGSGYTPSARLQGDVVRLKGGVTNGTGSADSGTLATIPSGLRPSVALLLTGQGFGGSSGPQTINISSAGALSDTSGLVNGASLFLDGVTYTLS